MSLMPNAPAEAPELTPRAAGRCLHPRTRALALGVAGLLATAASPTALAQGTDRAGRAWEAAIGMVADYSPEYAGAGRHRIDAEPVIYLRWGRFSLSNRSGFVNRSNDAVVRGIGVDLVDQANWRVATSLRYDGGREESESGALSGLGEVPATVRLRFSAVWRPEGTPLRLSAAWNGDALGRGAGWYSEFSLAREWRRQQALGPGYDRTWTLGVAFAAAGSRFMQNHYGVTAAQSVRSGYAMYAPGAGLRDGTLFATHRWPLSPHWAVTAGTAYTQKLGPTRSSPLVRDRSSVSFSLGAAYSF